jgi:hypothetical protein
MNTGEFINKTLYHKKNGGSIAFQKITGERGKGSPGETRKGLKRKSRRLYRR